MDSEEVLNFSCFTWWDGEGLYPARSASGHSSFHRIQCWQDWNFSAQQSEKKHHYSVPCLGWFAFLAVQNLSEVEMKWQKNYTLFNAHSQARLPLFFSCTNLCVFCAAIPTSGNLFVKSSQTKGKFITQKPTYSNLFTYNINHLNTLLPDECSVMSHASSAAPFYPLRELCSIFGINPLAS